MSSLKSGQYVDDSRYEYLDGRLLERPAPGLEHAELQSKMQSLLAPFGHASGATVLAEWSISDGTENWLTPDVTFSYRDSNVTALGYLLVSAYLVVEIRSTDQTMKDLFNKREAYRRWGVPHYWLIDPVESACYECLPAIVPCAEKLTADQIEIAVPDIFG